MPLPEVKGVYPKDVCVVLEVRLSDLKKLRESLDMCEINKLKVTTEQLEAARYLQEDFYPFLAQLIKDVEGHDA